MVRKKKVDTTFLTNDPKIRGKLMQLGHAFTQAVAEGNTELAKKIRQEALALKTAWTQGATARMVAPIF